MIVFLDAETLGSVDFSALKEFGDYKIYDQTAPSEILGRLQNAHVAITNKVRLEKSVIDSLPKLKAIIVTATGIDNIDFKAAQEQGIKVLNAKGYSTDSVVTHTFSMLMHFLHPIENYHQFTKEKNWIDYHQFTHFNDFSEMAEKKWGVIGLGTIGSKVANIATAFGAEVVYYSTSGKNNNSIYQRVELDELLSKCDIITIHAPLNENTRNLISETELNFMKSGAILLNLGRGGIINERDLAGFLKNNSDISVGLDVLEFEPIKKDCPLVQNLGDKNFLLTPHLAWASTRAREKLWQMTLENLKRV